MTEKSVPNLKTIHGYSNNHREDLSKSTLCGCFYCLKIYKPSCIKEWIDQSQTALCPYCGIDSVLPESSESLTKEMLEAMHNHYFRITR